ncbi:MAG: TIGR01777 family protein [Deltaproteobacteria bacterium]|nr:TIGR01777 family protein [Deltaproteobacteria bacterium]
MKNIVTGGTGFIGTRLIGRLENPVVLGRDLDRIRQRFKDVEARQWHPEGPIDPSLFSDVDTIFHLAGESIANGRWSRAKKARIMRSRVETTKALVQALSRLDQRPGTLICSSAIGYYGSRGSEILNESSPPGHDFLASVCQAWEEQAMRAEELGIRVVTVRTGIVLGPGGGVLSRMILPFKLGFGGRLGHGRQYMSWIHIDDLIGIMLHAAANDKVRGSINGVSPNPVTNRQFTAALAAALHRLALFPVPGLMLRLVLGELATVALSSQRVIPDKAAKTGYRFLHPSVEEALAASLQA